MGSKSKRLGKGFEYEVRDILRKATGDLSFERVPTSGAWVGGANVYKAQTGREDVTEIMAGDIICPKGWRWCVEAKNHEDVSIHQLILGNGCSQIDNFLKQVNSSAELAKKEPLLIMKWRRKSSNIPKSIKEALAKNNIPLPQNKTATLGILVAERYENCIDIQSINHIQYTGPINSDNTLSATWCFFDLNNWLVHLLDRQYKNDK